MSKIDPEALYLILTKAAASENFYNFNPAELPSSQAKGTITHRQLGEVYDRVTGSRTTARMNWNPHVAQLDALLLQCKLPPLTPVLLTTAEAAAPLPPEAQAPLARARATKWPLFSALKSLYRR